jgi:hypothetical protein
MSKLVDDRAPFSVRVAAALMSFAAVFEFSLGFMIQNPGQYIPASSGISFQAIVSLAVGLLLAWLVARLNGLAYGLTVIWTGLANVVWLIMWLLAGFQPDGRLPVSLAGTVLWIEGVLGIGILVLLVLPSSMKAPWSLSNGISRS